MHITVRIRYVNDEYCLQIKLPDTSKKLLYKSRLEYEIPLTSYQESIDDIAIPMIPIDDNIRLKMVGELLTSRKTAKISDMEISLDHSLYLGTEDYELEIEFCNNDDEVIKLLHSFGIVKFEKPDGKYKRLIKRFKAI